jgi:hypothetical protein
MVTQVECGLESGEAIAVAFASSNKLKNKVSKLECSAKLHPQ